MATEEEKRVPVFDWELGDFQRDLVGRIVTVNQQQAVEQIVIKALQTARSLYPIYYSANPDLHDKYGSEAHGIAVRQDLTEAVRVSELQRAIREALIYDPWVTDVSGVVITRQGSEEVVASFEVSSIFDVIQLEGVLING